MHAKSCEACKEAIDFCKKFKHEMTNNVKQHADTEGRRVQSLHRYLE